MRTLVLKGMSDGRLIAVMWVRQFSRDRDQGEAAENQAEARPRQGSQKTM